MSDRQPFVAFVVPPYAGHLNPALELAAAARGAGWRTEIITGPSRLDTVRGCGHAAFCPPSLMAGQLEAVPAAPRRTGSNPIRLLGQMRVTVRLIRPVRDELIARWRDDRPDVVVADFVAISGGLAAQALSIPWMTLINPAFVIESGDGPPSYLGGLMPRTDVWGRIRDRAGWAMVRTVKDALSACFSAEMRQLGLRRLRPDGTEAIYSPHAILAPTIAELEFSRRWPACLEFIGPLCGAPETVSETVLPEGRRQVLVTTGTHVPWAKAEMIRQTLRLSAMLPDFGFSVSLGSVERLGQPVEKAGSGVFVHPFVPYMRDLSRFDAVVHHGGAGVVLATLLHGLPSLVWPLDYDQFDYAARIQHHGLGHRVSRFDTARAAALLRAMIEHRSPQLDFFRQAAAAYRPRERFLARLDGLRMGGAVRS